MTVNYSLNNTRDCPIKIGVVIVNFNSSKYLLKALQALSAQLHLPDQVLLFDNASTEPLPDTLSAYPLNLSIIRSPQNLGFAQGNNQAIEQLHPDINWIALVNPDAYPRPEWLLEMVQAIRNHPQYHFFASKLICEQEPHLLDGTGDVYHISGKAWRRHHRKPLHLAPTKTKEIFSPCAAAALYEREMFTQAGGFDPQFFCYYEDIDLAFRLWLLGYKACYVPLAIAEHTGSASTKRHSDFYTYHGHRNLVWTYFKNMPLAFLLLFLPLHLLLNLTTVFLFGFRRQTKVILKAKKDALMGLVRITKQRKNIQKNRKISLLQLIKILHKGLPC